MKMWLLESDFQKDFLSQLWSSHNGELTNAMWAKIERIHIQKWVSNE